MTTLTCRNHADQRIHGFQVLSCTSRGKPLPGGAQTERFFAGLFHQ